MLRQCIRWISCLALIVVAQGVDAQRAVSGRVIDASTAEPLPFCHVAIQNSSIGTITNEDGVFSIQVSPDDTLLISYIGYETASTTANELLSNNDILLNSMAIDLGELTVYAEDTWLYDLVASCSKVMRKQPVLETRTYFNLETLDKSRPLEMIECYYNAVVQGTDVLQLNLKNGRVGWPVHHEGRYYVNMNTSKAILFLDILEFSDKFPANPLQYKAGKMRKRFRLTRLPSRSGGELIHISFEPLQNTGEYFSGDLWINENTRQLMQADLKVNDARIHPFQPLLPDSRIRDVKFNITFSFKEADVTAMQHINFEYDINILHSWAGIRESFPVKCKGLMYFYDYDDPFVLPYFDYDPDHTDYRKISFMPFDSSFWNSNLGYTYSEQQKQRIKFLEEEGVRLNFESDLYVGGEQTYGFFESSNMPWSRVKRLRFRNTERPNDDENIFVHEPTQREGFQPNAFNVVVQLFLDVNTYQDSTVYFSSAVFDVFASYNKTEEGKLVDCVANIAFDLGEIARREMMNELEEAEFNKERTSEIHAAWQKKLKKDIELFQRECQWGANTTMLWKWNEIVRQELGIDNMELFELSDK